MLKPMPKRQFISLEELTGTVEFLLSDAARNITGQCITHRWRVDRGVATRKDGLRRRAFAGERSQEGRGKSEAGIPALCTNFSFPAKVSCWPANAFLPLALPATALLRMPSC